MVTVFDEFLIVCLLLYIDNIFPHSRNKRQHLIHLRKIFATCRIAKIVLNLEKCVFMQTTIRILGFEISYGIIKPDEQKIDALVQKSRPQGKTDLRSYLSALQLYRSMLPQLSDICYPLYKLTSDKVKFEWLDEHEEAFNRSKLMLQQDMVNTSFDPTLPVILYTDASLQIGRAHV